MARVAIERVKFAENVEKPTKPGVSPNLDRIFDRNPTMGRHAIEIFLDDSTYPSSVVLHDPTSHVETWVPYSQVLNMTPCSSTHVASPVPAKATEAA